MKFLLFLACFSALFAFNPAGAQQVKQMTNPSNVTGLPDTISTATTTYLSARAYGSGNVAIQLNVKKVSGTVAGTAVLQACVDANFTPDQYSDVLGAPTFTFTNVSDQSYIWSISANFLHYRIKIVTTGTQVNAPKGFYYLKSGG